MSSKEPTAEELADDLREITVALRRRARAESVGKVVPGETLPYPQLAVLKRLETDGAVATADLARAEGMTAQSMGAIVAALEAGGHVRRRNDSTHGRRRLVSTTSAGRKALAINRAIRLRWTAKIIEEHFDADERRTLATAFSLLRRAFV